MESHLNFPPVQVTRNNTSHTPILFFSLEKINNLCSVCGYTQTFFYIALYTHARTSTHTKCGLKYNAICAVTLETVAPFDQMQMSCLAVLSTLLPSPYHQPPPSQSSHSGLSQLGLNDLWTSCDGVASTRLTTEGLSHRSRVTRLGQKKAPLTIAHWVAWGCRF